MYDEDLSLSIVTFNNADKIKKTIENLIRIFKGKVEYRLFIVDNGSTDGTIQIVEKLQKKNDQIIIINEKNIGFGAGHNKVIPHINSRYHIVLNPDIYVYSFNEINKMIQYMDGNLEIGLLSPLILNVDGTNQKLYKYSPTVVDLFIRFISPNFFKKRQDWFVRLSSGYNKVGHIDYASGSFMLFRTGVFKEIQGFDERYFMYMEDADITRKVNEASNAVFFPRSFVTHEWQRESHKKLKFMIISIVSMFRYFNKWGWKWY